MDKQQIVVGLDIGTTKIACLIGVKDEDNPDKVRIIGHGKVKSVGVEHGVVRNILKASQTIKYAVSLAAEQAQCSVTEVYVGIAGQHIKTKKNRGQVSIPSDQDYILEKDVDRMIAEQHNLLLDEGDEIIHIFPQAYYVDTVPLNDRDPVGVSAKQLSADFHIVTGNKTNIKNILQSVKLANLTVKGIVLEPIASSMAVLTEEDLEAGVALVDIGGGTTDIAIFANGVINHTHVVPVAGKTITDDIQKGFSVLPDTAERLKVQFGSCMPEALDDVVIAFPGYHGQPKREIEIRTLASIIKARTKDILNFVNLEIMQTGLQKQLVGGIVLTGGGSKLKDIVNYTSYITGINTRIGTPDEHISNTDDKKGQGIGDPIYATGIGLVLYGIGKLDEEPQPQPEEPQPQPEEPQPQPETIDPGILDGESEPAPEPAPAPEPSKPKKKTFFKALQEYFDRFLEKGDEEL